MSYTQQAFNCFNKPGTNTLTVPASFDMSDSAAPSLVLVTGASGFVSTWLIKELLEKGEYRVRSTVRNKSKREKVNLLIFELTL